MMNAVDAVVPQSCSRTTWIGHEVRLACIVFSRRLTRRVAPLWLASLALLAYTTASDRFALQPQRPNCPFCCHSAGTSSQVLFCRRPDSHCDGDGSCAGRPSWRSWFTREAGSVVRKKVCARATEQHGTRDNGSTSGEVVESQVSSARHPPAEGKNVLPRPLQPSRLSGFIEAEDVIPHNGHERSQDGNTSYSRVDPHPASRET